MHIRMEWSSVRFDWNQARAFLVTAEEGSLSAAARALDLTQPTLSRQVSALEEALGVALFERVGRTMALTPTGRDLLDHFRAMGEAATRVSLAASGKAQGIDGPVCISVSDVVAVCMLPPVIAKIREIAPGITVEIHATNAVSDLRRREADIAIRHFRPDQPELIARHIRDTSGHLYAAPSYLERLGWPKTLAEISRGEFMGYGSPKRLVEELNRRGLSITLDQVKFDSDNGVVMWELVRRGFGIGIMSRDIAAFTPDVVEIGPEFDPIPIPIWLTTHRELRTSRRIRLVFDLLAEALAKPPMG